MKKIISTVTILISMAHASNAQNWLTTGNSGTTSTNFIGTTDGQAFRFRVKNQLSGIIDSASGNVGLGYLTFAKNTTGAYNAALGLKALNSNTIGSFNTGIGHHALRRNTTGKSNTACGSSALTYNTKGQYNTATGCTSLNGNTTGNNNTGFGYGVMYFNQTGNYNTGVGYQALDLMFFGDGITALGYQADVTASGLTNAMALGYTTTVDASNKVVIGNTSVTSIGGQVAWTNYSDGRIKKNIKKNVPGLQFINLLTPITYNYDLTKENDINGNTEKIEYKEKYDIERINFTGFIAQEVDAAATKIGYDFSGVDKSGKIMGLRYSEFVVPLVKAVQELSSQNEALKTHNEQQQLGIINLQNQIDELKNTISSILLLQNSQSSKNNQAVTLIPAYTVEQNIPNPFKGTTTINCIVPVNNGNAYLNFYNQSGVVLKSIKVTGEGKNSITLTANELAAGTYRYALVVDNKMMDSKMMVKQ